jgi:ubiquitin C-terminal hydrolase
MNITSTLETITSKYKENRIHGCIRTYIGIANSGNLCYLNSILQILLSLDTFNDELIKNIDSSTIGKNYNDFFQNYISMIIFCRKKPLSSEDSITITKFVDNDHVLDIDNFKDNIDKIFKGSLSNEQHDAHEILIKVLDVIHEGMKNTSIVNDMFRGQIQSKLICGNCNNSTFNFNPFMDLSIYVDENITDISSAIEKYSCTECITDFHCQSCDVSTTFIKTMSFNQIPNYLIIHLNRFSAESNDDGFKYIKNNKEIILNKEIIVDNNRFVIKGAIFHHSGCINYGHYTSVLFIKELNYKCVFINDDDVVVSDWDDDMLKYNNYLVIYEHDKTYQNNQRRHYSF